MCKRTMYLSPLLGVIIAAACSLRTGKPASSQVGTTTQALSGSGSGGPMLCTDNSDCADGNPCTTDTCNGGACSYTNADGAACGEDGNECTYGSCAGGTCTLNLVADGTTCSDGLGTCQGGLCTSIFTPKACTQDADCGAPNDCSYGICTSGGSCSYGIVPNGVDCSSNGGTTCSGGSCIETIPEPCAQDGQCDDGNDCTDDSCNAGNCDNVRVADGAACTSNGSNGVCKSGTCLVGMECTTNIQCDDGNPCTSDFCWSGACNHQPASAGSQCTTGSGSYGTCQNGACTE